jgi:hypothetical protein
MIHGALGQLWAFTTFLSLLFAIVLGVYLWKISSEEEITLKEKGESKKRIEEKGETPTAEKSKTKKSSPKTEKIPPLSFSLKKKFATEDFLLKILESGNIEACQKTLKQIYVSPEVFEKYKEIFPENFLKTFKPNEEAAALWAKQSSLPLPSTITILEAKRRIARFQPAVVLTEDKEVIDFAESKKIPAYRFEDIF